MAAIAITIRDYESLPGELSDDGLTWYFPNIISINSNGKQMNWQIFVKALGTTNEFVALQPHLKNGPSTARGYISVNSGIAGGKTRDVVPTIVKDGKNIGKKSATNAVCQAMRDAFSLYNKQNKKAAGSDRKPPMLAQVLSQQKNPLPEYVFVQRKYNGVRCIICLEGDNVVIYSRTKGTYPGLDYIRNDIKDILMENPTYHFDGEIYLHGANLQDISGQARKGDAEGPEMNFMCYDMFDTANLELPYSQRYKIISGLKFHNHIVKVETFHVKSTEIEPLYRQFLAEKYEGAMIRLDEPYQFSDNSRHSKYLLKMKETLDHEYKIKGWTTGEKGKAAAALMIICDVDGKDFPVTPAMELDERIALAAKMPLIEPNGKTYFENNYLNREIIVYFDEFSKDNIPQRARTRMETRVD